MLWARIGKALERIAGKAALHTSGCNIYFWVCCLFCMLFVLENSSERSDSALLDSFLEKRTQSNVQIPQKLTDAFVPLLNC